ncbi:MAG TPA: carboxylesterase family protein, partial [Amaricoccus sp.]|nr:carboxylesterase family protein [Amaricoccus sp.]
MTPEALAIDGGQLAVSPPDDRGVHAFKGIPYARAPVGPLRWRPPEPPMAWPGVRRSDRFGP